ncbi:MAG: 16S rRNA (adenine(1518)-N(6)/adenine(1519)-N(6))-dimethyltransferase RsmA [Clostridiales bacterium]|nr:16S rRNA (adenine(1518)-N(6)/adenine(1519)-N(6))-dimethyltransferase RsmA [Clostridiales bacterium]
MNELRKAVKSGEIRPKRSLGQNFLTDRAVAERIVEAVGLTRADHVVEVGPGLCALTELLCESAGFVTAVEIDRHLVPKISEIMARYDNFRLIHADILKLAPEELTFPKKADGAAGDFLPESPSAFFGGRAKLVSNLPYYISTPVMMRFFEEGFRVSRLVFMMQKEVADRLVALPSTKAYGALTVAANFYAKPAKLFTVPPHCFVPQPDVESAVVALETYETPPVEVRDTALFFRVVRAAFAQRRKTLENCLIHAGLLPPERARAAAILDGAGVPRGARGETLDLPAFAALANVIGAG